MLPRGARNSLVRLVVELNNERPCASAAGFGGEVAGHHGRVLTCDMLRSVCVGSATDGNAQDRGGGVEGAARGSWKPSEALGNNLVNAQLQGLDLEEGRGARKKGLCSLVFFYERDHPVLRGLNNYHLFRPSVFSQGRGGWLLAMSRGIFGDHNRGGERASDVYG